MATTVVCRQPWIPPSGLIPAHLAHGVSWVLLWQLARRQMFSASMPAFAWIHLVALGWLSLIALSVLLFVAPQFTGAAWIGERWARLGLGMFAVGTYALVVAFWTSGTTWLWLAAALVVVGLGVYVVAAIMTLGGVLSSTGTDAAIARAFVVIFLFLLVAAILGIVMARSLVSGEVSMLATTARAHASLAAIGWLTLLVMGVSTRTLGPITGQRSPRRWVHILASGLVTLGALVLGVAPWTGNALEWIGTLACVVGLVIYALDVLFLALAATVPHRPPQAFVVASIGWLFITCLLAVAVLRGNTNAAPACVFVGLIGWIGQMVIAHLHHIGIRLIATMTRGDDDETLPEALLSARLSWSSLALFQVAVACGVLGLLTSRADIVIVAAFSGGLGWFAMTANIIRAVSAANAPAQQTAL